MKKILTVAVMAIALATSGAAFAKGHGGHGSPSSSSPSSSSPSTSSPSSSNHGMPHGGGHNPILR